MSHCCLLLTVCLSRQASSHTICVVVYIIKPVCLNYSMYGLETVGMVRKQCVWATDSACVSEPVCLCYNWYVLIRISVHGLRLVCLA